MNGDLLWHNTLWFGAREDAARAGQQGPDAMDFAPTLAAMRPLVAAADLAICHNEVPVAKAGGPYHSYPAFSAPPQTLRAVKDLGYDLCTTASNHSLDQGFEGLRTTLDQMDAVGLKHVGTARSQQEADTPVIFTTSDGVRIAVVEGAYGTNGIPVPKDRPWAWSGIDADSLLKRAQVARRAGAHIVLVGVHGGDEYQTRPNPQQVALAKKLTASDDVDLVYGHHVHVVQPITRVNGKWVAYGLGNLVAQHLTSVPRGYEGITTRFTFTEQPDGRFTVSHAEYHPTLTTHATSGSPARVLLVNEQLASGRGDRERLAQARERTTAAVNLLGHNRGLRQR
ncbi:CapA family protein [Luteococcus sp. H138]|uniref:CapA family protein n=1 Tax=unclassified Luteococcus TaxID=2639923 RepID=UPI00313C7361